MGRGEDTRTRLGAWYTPRELVAHVVESTLPARYATGQVVTVLDPACGDGRFLAATAEAIARRGGVARLTGIDVSPEAIEAAHRYPGMQGAELICADALSPEAGVGLLDRCFDVVVGNPPFLSPLSARVRSDSAHRPDSDRAGGQYADTAVQFLALAVRAAAENGGRIGMVMPLSVLASRDAGPVRDEIDDVADIRWVWWSPTKVFDAQVFTCAIGLVRRGRRGDVARSPVVRSIGPDFAPLPASELPVFDVGPGAGWGELIADDLGVPPVPADLAVDGELIDRALATADFRDQYYGMLEAVLEEAGAPSDAVPLVTTGLIDPGVCRWGLAPVRYAKQRFTAPVVAVDRLSPKLQDWVTARRVPKVMVATQTSVVEAVADPTGSWLPAVPVISVTPVPGLSADDAQRTVWETAAVLTSPIASAIIARRAAGTGISARVVRVTARHVNALPWPASPLDDAVAALQAGDLSACGRAVMHAYGVDDASPAGSDLLVWWSSRVGR